MISLFSIPKCSHAHAMELAVLLLSLDATFTFSPFRYFGKTQNYYEISVKIKESEHLLIKFLNDNMIDHEITFFD